MEISNIYKKNGRTRKIHNIVVLPSLAAVEALLSGEALGNGEMLAWQSHLGQGAKTSDPAITRHALEEMVEETAALLDGTSPITQRRVRQMKAIEGVLSL